jgi:hypothetical protein
MGGGTGRSNGGERGVWLVPIINRISIGGVVFIP